MEEDIERRGKSSTKVTVQRCTNTRELVDTDDAKVVHVSTSLTRKRRGEHVLVERSALATLSLPLSPSLSLSTLLHTETIQFPATILLICPLICHTSDRIVLSNSKRREPVGEQKPERHSIAATAAHVPTISVSYGRGDRSPTRLQPPPSQRPFSSPSPGRI